ncbi:restriction endonuclease [Opitutus terrae]|uniref:Restriction endonuclease n=1 Tax=Opitutus terrae (strain DSM 11246 / JCM 15787 / PB90-1) TaxID=452637 RepID=B1ZXG8_OPITP|nr:restriction endonuclease [Opitutus terrae]ACB76963.1 restriction endonuclease [Opitutus terrae PB90-1]
MLLLATLLPAAENSPVVGPGATRDEVLAAYGWPSGQSLSGGREIFTYPQGQVVLKDGVVERMDFSPNVPWPKPKPRPPAATASTKPSVAEKPVAVARKDAWLADIAAAKAEAASRAAQMLLLFTGSDWSPPSKRFEAEVANAPEFLAAVSDLVLVRLDFPRTTTLAPALREQNAVLRERYNVTTYPTLVLVDADGQEVSRVNLAKERREPTYREQVIAAVAEARPTTSPLVTRAGEAPAGRNLAGGALGRVSVVIMAGAVIVLGLCWWLIRRRAAESEASHTGPATILPTPADVAAWSQERLRDVAAALFEYEGSRVQVRPADSGADLALLHPSEPKPRVLVRCQAASAGLAAAKGVRTFFGTTVMEGVDGVWFVSAGGFTAEARQFAAEHGLVLISGEDLLQRLKAMPPLALMRALAPAR